MTPDLDTLLDVLDATWPPAKHIQTGPWHLRQGLGGGQRVSAATANFPILETDISHAENEMAALSQPAIFMIRPGDEALDKLLARRDYAVVDPVTVYVAPTESLAQAQPPAVCFSTWPPLAVQTEIWRNGGIDANRIKVMERAATPKTAILARQNDTPAGTAFVGIKNDIAMLHALEVPKALRRSGIGVQILAAAANWAQAHGARWFSLIVTTANVPANGLYRKLLMTPLAGYHYRRPHGAKK